MKAQITITWNPERLEETKITFSEEWNNLSAIEQADCLQDALGELITKYNERIEKGLV